MKICDIAQFYSPLSGGVKRYLSDKQRFLAAEGRAHHLLIVPSHRHAVTRSGTATVHEVKSPRLIGSRSYRLLIDRRRILEIVRAERPDLIEVGDPYRTAWIGLEAAREMQVPVLAFYHSDFPRALGRTVARFGGGWAERAVSGPVQRYIVRLYNHMTATVVSSRRLCVVLDACGIRRLVKVSLGTDANAFQPQPTRDRVRAELGVEEDGVLLLFVGRIAREKNIRHLVASLDYLPTDTPPHRLVLVGDGELHDFVIREARRRSNLKWLPYCESAQRLAEVYSAADLFVHPGKYETFGIVALEAQACGTRVLAVREGGVEDALVDDVRLLAPDGTPAGLASAISRYLRRRDTLEERRLRRERVVRQFSIETTFQRLFALYAHLIAGRSVEDFPAETIPEHELPRPTLHSR